MARHRPDAGDAALTLELVGDIETIRADWRRLENDPLNSLHQGLAWCTAWTHAFATPLVAVRGRVDGETVLIIPLEIVATGFWRLARFPGGSFNNINTGLFSADFSAAATPQTAARIDRELRRLLRGRADAISLVKVPLVWRGRRNPLAPLASVEHQNRAFHLPVLDSFEATLAQVNAKTRRRRFRIQSRRALQLGGYSHVVASTAEESRDLLETFFRLKAARFTEKGLPDAFRDPRAQTFFHALARDTPASDVGLELHALRLLGKNDGAIAAVAGLSRKGDHVICQFGAIDAALAADASPGELLFWLIIEAQCRQGPALFDFGLGDQPYKRGWCPVETVQHDIFLPLSTKGRLAAAFVIATAWAKTAIKARPRLYGAIQKMRAILARR